MKKRPLFSLETPLGYRVSLSRDRWRQIVRFKHPALAGHEKDVRRCLRTPLLVRASVKDADVHVYYAKVERFYLCVVTAPGDADDRFVVTAYFTKKIKAGNELWKK